MSITRVNKHYQVAIPADVRRRGSIDQGDLLLVDYDEQSGTIMLVQPKKLTRKRTELGRKIVLEDIKGVIVAGLERSLR